MKSRRSILKHSRQKRSRERQKHFLIIFVGILFLFILFIGFFAWVFSQERFLIKNINVYGNSVVQTEDIIKIINKEDSGKYLFLFKKQNIFIYPRNITEDRLLEELKRIKTVEIKRKGLDTLEIYITEYKPKYLWCGEYIKQNGLNINENCYFMNKEGYIYAKAPFFSGNVFLEWYTQKLNDNPVGSFMLNESVFNKLITLKDVIQSMGFDLIKITEQKEGDYAFIINGGSKILFNINQDSTRLIDTLDSVLGEISKNKTFEYIDLRFGNKVFYK